MHFVNDQGFAWVSGDSPCKKTGGGFAPERFCERGAGSAGPKMLVLCERACAAFCQLGNGKMGWYRIGTAQGVRWWVWNLIGAHNKEHVPTWSNVGLEA